jgi:hypothetical protein
VALVGPLLKAGMGMAEIDGAIHGLPRPRELPAVVASGSLEVLKRPAFCAALALIHRERPFR